SGLRLLGASLSFWPSEGKDVRRCPDDVRQQNGKAKLLMIASWGRAGSSRAEMLHTARSRLERLLDHQPVETTLYSLSESPPAAPDRRTDERYLSLFRVGTMKVGDRPELCLIRNVSAGGMMIRPYSPIATGTH